MTALVQRVKHASVTVDGECVSEIGKGFLVLFGVFENDTEKEADLLADKTAKLRIFTDKNDKMNLSLLNLSEMGEKASVLVVSQFTLCADCKGQNRPSFIKAARPEKAVPLYERYMDRLKSGYGIEVGHGIFGADMKVELLNDGPVTIVLDTDKL